MSASAHEQARRLAKSRKMPSNNAADVAQESEVANMGPGDPLFWSSITPDDIAAVKKGKGEEAKVEIIRRTKGPDGRYPKPSKDSGQSAKIQTATFRLSPKSTLAGAGNAGLEQNDQIVTHGKSTFSAGLALGNLDDGIERPGLEDAQQKCMALFNAICRKAMTDVFYLNMAIWKGPITRAYEDARKLMFSTQKNSDGEPLAAWTDMEALEQENEKVAEAVTKRAAVIFVDNARPLPGAPRKDENGNELKPVLYPGKKAWPFVKFNTKTDRRCQDTGPLPEKTPINIENWPFISRQMKLLRRRFNPVKYAAMAGGSAAALEHPKKLVETEQINENTGQRERVPSSFEDPFWSPALIDPPSGKPTEALVTMHVMFTVYRGDPSSNEKYGIRMTMAGPITIVCRAFRRAQVASDKASYATGMYIKPEAQVQHDQAPKDAEQDESEADDEDDGGANEQDEIPLEKPEVPAELPVISGSTVTPVDEDDEEEEAEVTKPAKKSKSTKRAAREPTSDDDEEEVEKPVAKPAKKKRLTKKRDDDVSNDDFGGDDE